MTTRKDVDHLVLRGSSVPQLVKCHWAGTSIGQSLFQDVSVEKCHSIRLNPKRKCSSKTQAQRKVLIHRVWTTRNLGSPLFDYSLWTFCCEKTLLLTGESLIRPSKRRRCRCMCWVVRWRASRQRTLPRPALPPEWHPEYGPPPGRCATVSARGYLHIKHHFLVIRPWRNRNINVFFWV